MDISNRDKTIVKKAMAYDLWEIVDSNEQKTCYTAQELKQLINDYIGTITGE